MSVTPSVTITVLLAAMWTVSAAAQNIQPVVLASGQTVEAELGVDVQRLPDGTPYACYAIHTAPGDRVSVSMMSPAFDAALQVARGALCSASALQHENDDFEAGQTSARVDFTAAGGRYLILARAAHADAAGAYTLRVQGGHVADTTRVASSDRQTERKIIMEREVAQREQQLAAAEAERLRQEAETARRNAELAAMEADARRRWAAEEAANSRVEESRTQPNVTANILEGFARGWAEAQQNQAALESRFDDTRATIARLQADDTARRERDARAAEAARAAQVRAAQAEAAAARARYAAQAAELRRREVALAQSPPVQGARVAGQSAGTASTRDDPRSCVSPPVTSRHRCTDLSGFKGLVSNTCPSPVDVKICFMTSSGWNCQSRYGLGPEQTWEPGWCHASTGEVFHSVRYSDSSEPLANP